MLGLCARSHICVLRNTLALKIKFKFKAKLGKRHRGQSKASSSEPGEMHPVMSACPLHTEFGGHRHPGSDHTGSTPRRHLLGKPSVLGPPSVHALPAAHPLRSHPSSLPSATEQSVALSVYLHLPDSSLLLLAGSRDPDQPGSLSYCCNPELINPVLGTCGHLRLLWEHMNSGCGVTIRKGVDGDGTRAQGRKLMEGHEFQSEVLEWRRRYQPSGPWRMAGCQPVDCREASKMQNHQPFPPGLLGPAP
jgi:hypothetical protein